MLLELLSLLLCVCARCFEEPPPAGSAGCQSSHIEGRLQKWLKTPFSAECLKAEDESGRSLSLLTPLMDKAAISLLR